jgi:hypothetical protein
MTDEPMTEPEPAAADRDADAGPSTDLVVPARRPLARADRRRPGLAVRVRRQLAELRQNPAAMVAVSAAATVGSAVVTAGLRRTLRPATSSVSPAPSPARRTASLAIGGYVVHEVHVVHHVVHHAIRPPAD